MLRDVGAVIAEFMFGTVWRRLAWLVLALMLVMRVTIAGAQPVTVTLSEDEQRALYQVFDTAVRAGGMETARLATGLWARMQEQAAAQRKKVEAPK